MPRLSVTHTYVLLECSAAAYDEIAAKLREAGYDYAFGDGGEIDMHGIPVTRGEAAKRCARCGAAIECKPGPECWCASLPQRPIPAGATGCWCRLCLELIPPAVESQDEALRPPAGQVAGEGV